MTALVVELKLKEANSPSALCLYYLNKKFSVICYLKSLVLCNKCLNKSSTLGLLIIN